MREIPQENKNKYLFAVEMQKEQPSVKRAKHVAQIERFKEYGKQSKYAFKRVSCSYQILCPRKTCGWKSKPNCTCNIGITDAKCMKDTVCWLASK